VECARGDEVRLTEADEIDDEVDIGMGRERVADRMGGGVLDRLTGSSERT